MSEQRPRNCRFRLQDEGKPYPRSSCQECGRTITTGLGTSCHHTPTLPQDPVGWRDISTAPKDGTRILIYEPPSYEGDPDVQYVVRWNGEKWEEALGEGYSTFDATHWRPLPAAPDQPEQPSVAEAAREVLAKRQSIMSDISSAHQLRGDGASSWMREDDREFRAELSAAFDKLDAALRAQLADARKVKPLPRNTRKIPWELDWELEQAAQRSLQRRGRLMHARCC